LVTLI